MPLSIASNFYPCFKTVFFKLQSVKPTSFFEFPSTNSVFLRGFVSKEAEFQKIGVVELTRTRISYVRCRNGDEGFGSLETKSFIDGSNSEFRPQIAADGLDLEAMLNKLSKWILVAFFAGVILLRHDTVALWTATGFVTNIVVSVVLKRILNQDRPAALRSDPGMPSSHAQSLFFATFFVIMSVVERLGVNAISLSISGLSFIIGSYFSLLRVSQRLHSMSQVFVGGVLGGCFSILWYLLWKVVVMEAFTKYLWVQVVVLGASVFCIGFFIYILNHFRDDI